jgi:hypothetical protein
VKCDKCGYVSYDYNATCPACDKDLSMIRSRLGIHYSAPEVGLDEFFTGSSGLYQTAPLPKAEEAELDLESVGDDFEFTLDD